MKSKTTANHSPTSEQTVTDLANFAWCALVALRLAYSETHELSPLMAHTFLFRWLSTAQKQRRFPRSIAPDIEQLLRLSRLKGLAAGLHKRLELLYESSSMQVSHQSALFRLAKTIKKLKAQGWENEIIPDHEWDIPTLVGEYTDVSALLVKQSELKDNFAEGGNLVGSITFIVKGNLNVALMAFDSQAFHYAITVLNTGNEAVLTLLQES